MLMVVGGGREVMGRGRKRGGLFRISLRAWTIISISIWHEWTSLKSESSQTTSYTSMECSVDTTKPKHPGPQSQSLSRSYGSNLPTSLTYIILSTRGCSPRRPAADMGTSWRDSAVTLSLIFKVPPCTHGSSENCWTLWLLSIRTLIWYEMSTFIAKRVNEVIFNWSSYSVVTL